MAKSHISHVPVLSHSLLVTVLLMCVSTIFCAPETTTIFDVTTTAVVKAVPDCDEGFYGFQCQQECSPNCASMECHDMTGECVGGCKMGWYGAICEYACEEGTYGNNCSSECPDNCIGGVCDPVTGTCYKGCTDGFLGDQCDRVCSQGKWGEDCKMECSPNCATPHCHFQTGYCLKGCKEDFWGADCSLFGNIRDVPEQMRGKFYSQLSAESRSVLLYILMGQYERTLDNAKKMVRKGLDQRSELRQLLAGRALGKNKRH